MTTTLRPFNAGQQLTTSVATYYTGAASSRSVIYNATVTNTSASDATFDLHLVPVSGSASDANLIIKDKLVPAGQTYHATELSGKIISNNGTIQASASAATTLSLNISGAIQN
ncbi:MAG: hypothetical protein AAF607_10135 [Pseudomonadota bacterium]